MSNCYLSANCLWCCKVAETTVVDCLQPHTGLYPDFSILLNCLGTNLMYMLLESVHEVEGDKLVLKKITYRSELSVIRRVYFDSCIVLTVLFQDLENFFSARIDACAELLKLWRYCVCTRIMESCNRVQGRGVTATILPQGFGGRSQKLEKVICQKERKKS